jgi:hypothetical protein
MTTASICYCSLLWECWVSVGMFSSFRCFHLADSSRQLREISRRIIRTIDPDD